MQHEGNDMAFVVQNNNSYKYTGAFGKSDVLLGSDGSVVARGDDAVLAKYRKEFAKRMQADR
jgi:hypothetical protein